METQEQIVAIVKAYSVGRAPDSIVVVIPKKLDPKNGQRYIVKKDCEGRLIYQPIPEVEP